MADLDKFNKLLTEEQKLKRDYLDEACKNIQVMRRLNQRDIAAVDSSKKVEMLQSENNELKR